MNNIVQQRVEDRRRRMDEAEKIENCSHKQRADYQKEIIDDWTGEKDFIWVEDEISFIEDLDLHRYHCTRCKKVMYYSGRAKDYYEKGIKYDIDGLDK